MISYALTICVLLRKQTQETIVDQAAVLLRERACIARACPVEQSTKRILSHIIGLHPDSLRRIISDEASITANAICGANALIHMFSRTGPRQLAVFKSTVFSSLSREFVAYPLCPCETSTVCWDTQDDLVSRHSLADQVGYGRVAGYTCCGAVRILRAEKLGLVATFLGPWAGIVVSHEVNHVKVKGGMAKIDMLKRPFAGRKSGSEGVLWAGQILTNVC